MIFRHNRMAAASLGGIFTLVVLLTLIVSLRPSTTSARPVLANGRLGDWQFQYQVPNPDTDGSTIITYAYPSHTRGAVEAAAAALNRTAGDLAHRGQPFNATLVFAEPLSVDTFSTLVRRAKLTPTSSILRVVFEDGELGIVGAPPEWQTDAQGRFLYGMPKAGGQPIDLVGLVQFSTGHHPFRVIGVVSTDVTLDQTSYEQVKRTSEVYVIDVMQHILAEAVQQQHPGVRLNHTTFQGSRLYAAMEETQIAPDPTQR